MSAKGMVRAGLAAAAVLLASELVRAGAARWLEGFVPSVAFGGAWTWFVVAGLGYGFCLAWLSAVVQARHGGRLRVAVAAAAVVWTAGYLLPDAGIATLSFGPRRTLPLPEPELAIDVVLALTWGAAEVFLAALAAGYAGQGEARAAGAAPAR